MANRLAALVRRVLTRRPPAPPAPAEAKASRTGHLIAFEQLGEPVWAPRDYATFAREGFMQNAVAYRCVRMISDCAASVPLLLYRGTEEIEAHPLLDLLGRPNAAQTAQELLEVFYGFLLVSGNAYLEAVAVGSEVRELHALRPDRVRVIPGPDGWPEAFDYAVAGRTQRIEGEAAPGIRAILHQRLFHPANDHYGLSPIEAAATAIDIHNAASRWNKALLDNSARPSGALVYSARDGQLTPEQFERLRSELEAGFQGAANAGRPLLLEGGLDWKAMSLSPKDLDFVEAKNAAAREIALAMGVPPMLLGIPGDNTYANFQEANRALWRQTVLPLVTRTARALAAWLAPGEGLELRPDLDAIEALAPEREALWSRLEAASFLSTSEKRAAAGYGEGDVEASAKAGFNPAQPRDEAGRWSDGGTITLVAKPKPTTPSPTPTPAKPAPRPDPSKPPDSSKPADKAPPGAPEPLHDILLPNGQEIGRREPGVGDGIRTVTPVVYAQIRARLLAGAIPVPAPPGYDGTWYRRSDGSIVGERRSDISGPTLEIIRSTHPRLKPGYKVHVK